MGHARATKSKANAAGFEGREKIIYIKKKSFGG